MQQKKSEKGEIEVIFLTEKFEFNVWDCWMTIEADLEREVAK